ncbi:hypothetical protein HYPSUDRAFT_61735 [Hypholoma sublateritium FD-334 SS-4]|uniref:Uncharacterized protein n=1 Tax=Hypholoma sublateritium (strain FD-334 SS-4) TaxID=945553 RepID=A0A0D2LLN9_HYPSF|nr:hypothetical protein HYPSUDRAFT_61735 [Hypholoma sublateritium FD-334 SS-4]
MQFKFFATAFVTCMTAFVSAAPVPILIAPALEAREIGADLNTKVPREAEPVCARFQCW